MRNAESQHLMHRGTIAAVQGGGVIIYLAAVETLRNKERQGETQENDQSFDGFLSFTPPRLNASVLFCRFFFESHPVYDQTRGTDPVFS